LLDPYGWQSVRRPASKPSRVAAIPANSWWFGQLRDLDYRLDILGVRVGGWHGGGLGTIADLHAEQFADFPRWPETATLPRRLARQPQHRHLRYYSRRRQLSPPMASVSAAANDRYTPSRMPGDELPGGLADYRKLDGGRGHLRRARHRHGLLLDTNGSPSALWPIPIPSQRSRRRTNYAVVWEDYDIGGMTSVGTRQAG